MCLITAATYINNFEKEINNHMKINHITVKSCEEMSGTGLAAVPGLYPKPKRYSVKCSWCQKHMYFSDEPNSHGICKPCMDFILAENNQ